MELIKAKDHLTYQIDDVTFIIRAQATVKDKFEMDMVGDLVNESFIVDRTKMWLKMVELFVLDWQGVTEDGKPVPYSFQTMTTRLPADTSKDWILKLGAFIAEKLSLFGTQSDESKKNGSPTP